MVENIVTENDMDTSPSYSELKRIISVFWNRKVSVIGLSFILLLIFAAIFAPKLAPYDPYEIDLANKLLKPSQDHLLGTDSLGRDTLSRIIYGSRTSIIVGIASVSIGAIVGQSMGLIAAFFGGWIYSLIMRFIDAIMCIPPILIAMVIASALGGGMNNVIAALAFGVVPLHARVMCAQAMTINENDYILASKARGLSNIRIILRHLLPNAFPPLLVLVTIDLGVVILAEAGLSFLGLGIKSPMAAWGSMVNDGYKYLLTNPVLSFAPGLTIMLIVFGFNMVGDGLRDSLDPRLRGAF